MQIAEQVKAKTVVLEPPRFFDFKHKQWLKKSISGLRKKYGFHIALKNGPSEYMWGVVPGRSYNSLPDLQNFKEICLDISNLYAKKMDLMRTYEALSKHLVHVHISNAKQGKEHALMDDGIMPLESFLTKLNKDNYSGDLSLLVHPRAVEAGNDKSVLKQLKKSRKFYDKYFVF